MPSKTILVCGGAGYIGAHMCKTLARAGHKPVTFDNLSTGHRNAVKWGPLEKGDLLNQADLERVFTTYKFDAVMHFAGVIVKSGVWRSSGVPVGLIGNLFSILELDVVYDQFQLSEPPDSPPAFLCVLKQLEHHRQGCVS